MQPIEGVRLPLQRPAAAPKRERTTARAADVPTRPSQPGRSGDLNPADDTETPRVSDRDLGIWFG